MNKLWRIEKPEGFFGIDYVDHFFIDCSCGVKIGSHYENPHNTLKKMMKVHIPYCKTVDHTFLMNEELFRIMLTIQKETNDSGLIVVCNNCQKKFEFTVEKYSILRDEILGKEDAYKIY